MTKPKVFIDGEAGTTGLQIYSRLSQRDDIELVSLDAGARKDAEARSHAINSVDVAILCLPDDASREAVSFVNSDVKILDASTAHRTAEGWVYGFPELQPGQREKISKAQFVKGSGIHQGTRESLKNRDLIRLSINLNGNEEDFIRTLNRVLL